MYGYIFRSFAACVARAGNAANLKDERMERKRLAGVLIHKLSMAPRSAMAVTSWAFSPRLSHTYGGNTDWLPLSMIPTFGVDPNIVVVENTIRLHARLGSLDDKSQQLYNRVCQLVQKALATEACRMHAECAILLHAVEAMRYARDAGAEPVRFCNYIAVSKLSCPCCHVFIKAWNEQHKTNWVTSGCHHKPYKWSILVPDKDPPDGAYYECVKAVWRRIKEYLPDASAVRFIQGKTPSQPRSDSSGEANHETLDDDIVAADRAKVDQLEAGFDALDALDEAEDPADEDGHAVENQNV